MFSTAYNIKLNTLFLTIVLVGAAFLSTAQSNDKTAKKLLEQEKFEEALPYYEQLYNLYPDDMEIQYGYGACLTETGSFTSKAKKLLLQASLNNAPIKVYYFIGKIYHATNDFETAIEYYSRFEEKAKSKVVRKLNIESLLAQCQSKENPFEETLSIDKEQTLDEEKAPLGEEDGIIEGEDTLGMDTDHIGLNPEIQLDAAVKKDTTQTEIAALQETAVAVELPESITESEKKVSMVHENGEAHKVPEELKDTLISFMVNSWVKYLKIDQFRTQKGQQEFIRGWITKRQLESKTKDIAKLRMQYSQLSNPDEKEALAAVILDQELALPTLKRQSDQAFVLSLEKEMEYWRQAGQDEIELLQIKNDSLLAALKPVVTKVENIEPTLIDNTNTELIDTLLYLQDTIVEKNQEIEEEGIQLVYRIQIGAYSKGLPEYIDRLYKKLSVLRKIDNYTDDKGVTVYTVGEVSNFDDALKLQGQIRQEGVKDAFVVAYNNGKRITLREARELTKE